jgi:hypothetical protein
MNRHERSRFVVSPKAIINALIIAGQSYPMLTREEIINALITRRRKRAEPPGRCIFKTQT